MNRSGVVAFAHVSSQVPSAPGWPAVLGALRAHSHSELLPSCPVRVLQRDRHTAQDSQPAKPPFQRLLNSCRHVWAASGATEPGRTLVPLPAEPVTGKGCSLFSLSFCSKFFTFSSSFSLSDSSDLTTDCKVFAEAFSPRSTVICKNYLRILRTSRTKSEHHGNILTSKGWIATKNTRQRSPEMAQISKDLILRFNYAKLIKKND